MNPPITRRDALRSAACGFGYLALAGLSAEQARAGVDPLSVKPPHHKPRAKRVIFLFMQGGVSQVDSYDYKPLLQRENGREISFEDARQLANTGKKDSTQRVMQPLWRFARHGESGRWASDLFARTNEHIDDFCMIHSVHTEGVAHGPATLFLHCGASTSVRPSMGSWVLYGLGSENHDLPGFVTIAPSSGNGGARNYGSGFLPSVYQGTPLGRAGSPASEATIRNLTNHSRGTAAQRRYFELQQALNREQARSRPGDSELEAVIASYELAWRMQAEAPTVMDLSRESRATRRLYGIDDPVTADFGTQCLLARRMCEAGVRFIQVTYGDGTANPAWDQHSNMPKHADHARAVDRPIAGLLADLKQRGLLEDTIVWWGSEFGRTPYAEKKGTGRDHNPGGFTVWLAGGGFKAGYSHGATDEFGHHAVVDKLHMHDLHATILHALGLDHEKLTYRYQGRDFRLTDVAGRVETQLFT